MYALFDIGGTKTRIAVSNDHESIEEVSAYSTPRSYTEGVANLVEALKQASGGKKFTACVGGIRGPLDAERSGIVYDNVLTDWQHKSLSYDLGSALDVSVHFENDTALAGLGETHYGAGIGADIVAYHTVSTGVGGVRIDHGSIDAYSRGFEPGAQTIDIDGTSCPDCEDGDLEDHISGSAVRRRFHKEAYEIPQTDPVWDDLARVLAHGLRNTIAYWSPDVIVLGGSMIVGDPRIRIIDVERHLRRIVGPKLGCPPVKAAALGDLGGIWGALAYLKQKEGSN